MIIIKCTVLAVSVLEQNISIKMTAREVSGSQQDDILKAKKKVRLFDFERNREVKLSFNGTIESVNFRTQLHMVIHTHKESDEWNEKTVNTLMRLMGQPVYLVIKTYGAENESETKKDVPQVEKVQEDMTAILMKAADVRDVPPGDLLFELTSFKNKREKVIPGKRSLEDLSAAQLTVVKDKLNKIISQTCQK